MEVNTEDSFIFVFLPCQTQSLNFSVKGRRDASIALANKPNNPSVVFELVLGGSWNTMAVIKKRGVPVSEYLPLSIKENTFQDYWLKWNNNQVRFGAKGNDTPLLSIAADKEVPKSRFFGIRTCWGSTGTWKFVDEGLNIIGAYWEEERLGEIPKEAFIAGFEEGTPLYIGRSYMDGGLMIGKISSHHNFMEDSDGDIEVGKTYQVLCGIKEPQWKTVRDVSKVPSNAFVAGFTKQGSPLFIGRTECGIGITVGEVEKPSGLHLSSDGVPFCKKPYQILVIPKKFENIAWK